MVTDPVRADFAVHVPKHVHYHEVDMQNIVFNANYLVFADIAVTEYFRVLSRRAGNDGSQAMDFFGDDHDCTVRHAEIDFRKGARADDRLDMGVRCMRLGGSSFTVQTAMFRGEDLLALVHIRYVHVNKASWRPVPLTEHFRRLVVAVEPTAPEGTWAAR